MFEIIQTNNKYQNIIYLQNFIWQEHGIIVVCLSRVIYIDIFGRKGKILSGIYLESIIYL